MHPPLAEHVVEAAHKTEQAAPAATAAAAAAAKEGVIGKKHIPFKAATATAAVATKHVMLHGAEEFVKELEGAAHRGAMTLKRVLATGVTAGVSIHFIRAVTTHLLLFPLTLVARFFFFLPALPLPWFGSTAFPFGATIVLSARVVG